MVLPWLPGHFHVWSLHIYHDRKVCYRHLMDYTLTERFGWPKWKAWLAAVPTSIYLQGLMRSAKAIPVYRDSMKIIKTYQLSLNALKKGESILIFPDQDYTSTEKDLESMYDGFLAIDRLYFRETGQHIPFVTLYADEATRTIEVGEPILFTGDVRDEAERTRVAEAIRRQLSGLPATEKDQGEG